MGAGMATGYDCTGIIGFDARPFQMNGNLFTAKFREPPGAIPVATDRPWRSWGINCALLARSRRVGRIASNYPATSATESRQQRGFLNRFAAASGCWAVREWPMETSWERPRVQPMGLDSTPGTGGVPGRERGLGRNASSRRCNSGPRPHSAQSVAGTIPSQRCACGRAPRRAGSRRR
jgi:hypothetical protein